MPQIIQENKQLQALSDIAEELAVIGAINSVLMGNNVLFLTASDSDGKLISKVPIEERDNQKALSIISSQRSRLVKDVRGKADKYRIALDDEDNACLEGAVPQKRGRGRKAQSECEASAPAYVEDQNEKETEGKVSLKLELDSVETWGTDTE